jgi:hypothetical protein
MQVKEGTRWSSSDGNVFHVINVIEVNGHTWVHYEQDDVPECRLFSCWIESFVSRFSPVLNESRR